MRRTSVSSSETSNRRAMSSISARSAAAPASSSDATARLVGP